MPEAVRPPIDRTPSLVIRSRNFEIAKVLASSSGVGTMLLGTMRLVATDVRRGVFEGCGHYMPEEAPRAVAEQIIRFMIA
jgi:hypothetical protein